jgi:hypothetical protein
VEALTDSSTDVPLLMCIGLMWLAFILGFVLSALMGFLNPERWSRPIEPGSSRRRTDIVTDNDGDKTHVLPKKHCLRFN